MSQSGPEVSETAVQAVIERLRAAPKYRPIHLDTIADIIRQEAPNATSAADLERLARLRLHRAVAGYLFTGRPARLLRGLDQAIAAGQAATRDWCRTVLGSHFSTAERLPDLDLLYPAIIGLTGPIGADGSIADLACAINPFTVPWLREATAARYAGYDLNLSYVQAGAEFLARAELAGTVRHRDVLMRPDQIDADVALLLKTFHCIEDRKPGSGMRLVQHICSPWVVVSFPVRTMSGRPPAFARRHIDGLLSLADRRGWELRRASLSTEDLVVIRKGDGGGPHG
jgi:16S rRNA (guanine(1405)-N(7))-methyltransferase